MKWVFRYWLSIYSSNHHHTSVVHLAALSVSIVPSCPVSFRLVQLSVCDLGSHLCRLNVYVSIVLITAAFQVSLFYRNLLTPPVHPAFIIYYSPPWGQSTHPVLASNHRSPLRPDASVRLGGGLNVDTAMEKNWLLLQ